MAAITQYIKRTAEIQQRVLATLAELFDTAPLNLPTASRHGREHLVMLQWQKIEAWLDTLDAVEVRIEIDPEVAEGLAQPVETETSETPDEPEIIDPVEADEPDAPNYDAMTKAELQQLADVSGVVINVSRPTKADIIEALRHADANNE